MKIILPANIPPKYYKAQMPSISQADERYKVLRENPGGFFCGPVAVANILVFLARNGHQMLLKPCGNLGENQAIGRLVSQLSKLMDTCEGKGTSPDALVDGTDKYIVDRGYQLSRKKTFGWGGGNKNEADPPASVVDILEAAYEPSSAVVQIGYYLNTHSRKNGIFYKRQSGHYVTSAGYDDAKSKTQLIFHDPDEASEGKPVYYSPQELTSGTIVNPGNDKKVEANHHISLRAYGINTVIVDSVFAFEVERK